MYFMDVLLAFSQTYFYARHSIYVVLLCGLDQSTITCVKYHYFVVLVSRSRTAVSSIWPVVRVGFGYNLRSHVLPLPKCRDDFVEIGFTVPYTNPPCM